MAIATETLAPGGRSPRQPAVVRNDRRKGDRVFRGVARGTGYGTLVILILIGLFLLIEGFPAFHVAGWSFFTSSGFQTIGKTKHFGVEASLYGTVVVALIALAVGTPVAIATALFLTEYTPKGLRPYLIAGVDLAAAIPSVIYGLWAIFELQPNVVGISGWLARHVSWIPIFKVATPKVNASLFIAGLVVGIMIVPIVASVTREVFSLTPAGREGGRPGTRGDEGGHDPPGRAAFRAGRDDQRRHARDGAGPRRNHRRGHHPERELPNLAAHPAVGREHGGRSDRRPLRDRVGPWARTPCSWPASCSSP